MSSNIIFSLTNSGAQVLNSATNKGLRLELAFIALGTGKYAPDRSETALKEEKQRVAIQAGNISEADNVLQYSALFPPDTSAGNYDISEMGIFAYDPDSTSSPKSTALIFIFSALNPVAKKSEQEEFYLSVSQSLTGVDPSKIEIKEANTDFRLLLQAQFDRYVKKTDVANSLEELSEAGKIITGAPVGLDLSARLSSLEAKSGFINHGNFPPGFAPVDLNALKIKAHSTNTNGKWGFEGGEIVLYGHKYALPAWEGAAQEIALDTEPSNIRLTESQALISSLGAPNGSNIYITLEMDVTLARSGIFDLRNAKIKASLQSPPELKPSELFEGKAIIKLATLAKGTSYIFEQSAITNEDLVDKFKTLKLDCAKYNAHQVNFVSDAKVKFHPLALKPKQTVLYANRTSRANIEFDTTNSSSDINLSRYKPEVQTGRWTPNVFFVDTNEIRFLGNDYTFKEIEDENDRIRSDISTWDLFPLGFLTYHIGDRPPSNKWTIADGRQIARDQNPDYADLADNMNFLSIMRRSLGREADGMIYAPDARDFIRGVTSNVGRYQDDALKSHVHGYLRPGHGRGDSGFGTFGGGESHRPLLKVHSDPHGAGETRPKNQGYLPIIKVKK